MMKWEGASWHTLGSKGIRFLMAMRKWYIQKPNLQSAQQDVPSQTVRGNARFHEPTATNHPLTPRDWRKTPYAQSDARDPDGAVNKLLAKYGVSEIVTALYRGRHDRPAWGVRFVLNGKGYRVSLETLSVEGVPAEKLMLAIRSWPERLWLHF
jgi:hypothetical protein